MTTTTTTQAPCQGNCCGGKCGGEQVSLRVGADRKTGRGTMTYGPCSVLVGQGWRGKVAEVRWMPEAAATALRHRDGLVVFG